MIEINLLQLLIQCRLVKLSFNHLISVSPHAKRVAGEGK